MNSKKILSGIVGVLLIAAMVAVLAGCASIEQRVFSGMKKLQDAKAMQGKLSMDATVDMDMAGMKQSIPMKMSMDMTRSGEDAAMKGTVSTSLAGTAQEMAMDIYVKDGYTYTKVPGQDKYVKTKVTDLQSGINTSDQIIKLLKDVDLTKAKLAFEKTTLTVDGKSTPADKVKVSLPDDQTNKLMQSLIGDALNNVGQGTQNADVVKSLLNGLTMENFSFTLYLAGDNIAREEVTMKITIDLSKVETGAAGVTGSMAMDFNIGVDIVKTADSLPITFPVFNESNTTEQ